jgi:hypothetical protein
MSAGITKAIGKILSANDTGETGSHQVGVLIRKDRQILSFFPELDSTEFNPDALITFTWDYDNTQYELRFVYYNGKLHGENTRNEYRLTRTTGFFRDSGLKAGDTLVLYKDDGRYYISDRPPAGGIVPSDEDWIVIAER